MGVRNLWKLLEPFGTPADVRGRRLAVDTSIWMHQLRRVADPYLPYVVARRIAKLLCNQITPIFVFDGGVPALKRRTVRRRRENAMRQADAGCDVCGGAPSVCGHLQAPGRGARDAADAEVLERIRGHEYNWGELSEESESGGDTREYDREAPPDPGGAELSVNPISLISEDSFSDLPRTQRLRKLVEMRQYRRLPMELPTASSSEFSLGQIENVKKRNMVRRLIDEISSSGQRRVQSDWKRQIQYEREPVPRTHARHAVRAEDGPSTESAPPGLLSADGPAGAPPRGHADDGAAMAGLLERYGHLARHCESRDGDAQEFTYRTSAARPAAPAAAPRPRRDDPLEWMHEMADREGLGPERLSYRACRAPQEGRQARVHAEPAQDQDRLVNDLHPLDGWTLRIQTVVKTVLDIFSICFVDSPEESDSQCAFLCRAGVVDGVVTEDNDLILHGATVYRNFFSRSKPVTVYTFEDVSRGLALTQTGLIKLSFLLGSDYTPGVYGIGIKRALARVESVAADDIAELERVYTAPNVSRIDGFENGTVDAAALSRYLCQGGLPREKADELLAYVSALGGGT